MTWAKRNQAEMREEAARRKRDRLALYARVRAAHAAGVSRELLTTRFGLSRSMVKHIVGGRAP